ncbi:MAG: hypothetical protein ACE14W_11680, partial [Candidatus Velamenicoccus archaeovorus]
MAAGPAALTCMATLVFLLKRFVAQRLLGLAIVVTLAFTVGVLVAGPIYADAAREAIFSSAIRTSPVNVVNARFAVYGDPGFDAAGVDAEVRDATAALPLSRLISQGRGTVRLAAAGSPGAPLSITVLFRDGAVDHVPYRGRPPGPGQIALPQAIARVLGVGRDDRVTILGPTDETATLTVAGTFDRPEPADNDYWYGGQSPFPAADQRAPGVLGVAGALPPLLMERNAYLETIPRLDVTTEYVWDAYLDYRGLAFARGASLPGRISQIDAELHGDPELSTLKVTTGLPTLMELVRQRISRLRVPILLVVFQIGAVTLAV